MFYLGNDDRTYKLVEYTICFSQGCFASPLATSPIQKHLNILKGNQAEETDFVRFHLKKQLINTGYRGGLRVFLGSNYLRQNSVDIIFIYFDPR